MDQQLTLAAMDPGVRVWDARCPSLARVLFGNRSPSGHLSKRSFRPSSAGPPRSCKLQVTLSAATIAYMKSPVPVKSASALIDEKIKELGDWRGKTLAKVREIIYAADPEIVEEWKWMGTPVFSHG